MRIRFTENVDVELSKVPRSAYGAIGIRHPPRIPRLKTTPGEPEQQFKMEPVSKSHFFRQGWCAELPDETAQAYIDAGQAEATKHKVCSLEEVESVSDMAMEEIRKLPAYREAIGEGAGE